MDLGHATRREVGGWPSIGAARRARAASACRRCGRVPGRPLRRGQRLRRPARRTGAPGPAAAGFRAVIVRRERAQPCRRPYPPVRAAAPHRAAPGDRRAAHGASPAHHPPKQREGDGDREDAAQSGGHPICTTGAEEEAVALLSMAMSIRPDQRVERVTGIEPAQSAWKAWSSERCPCCSAACRAAFVPSGCLSIALPLAGTAQQLLPTSYIWSDA
jgi:hypothetical protein